MTPFDSDSPEDTKARAILNREAKAAAFDDALAVAKAAPATARQLKEAQAEIRALKAQADRPVTVTITPPVEKKRGPSQVSFPPIRLLALAAFGGMKQHVTTGEVDHHIGDLFALNKGIHQTVIRSATNVATTTGIGWAGELVQTMTGGFIKDLARTSAAAQLIARKGAAPFGSANSITWPMRAENAKGSLRPAWVTENDPIPVLQTAFGSVTLNRFKMAAIATATTELLRTSNPEILGLIEQFIREDASTGLDQDMFDPTTGGIAGTRPSSLTFGATNQPSAGASLADIVTDLKWLRAQMSASNAVDPVLIMHSDRLMGLQMVQGTADTFPLREELAKTGALFGVPIIHSPYVDPDTVVAIDAGKVIAGVDPVLVDTSSAVTLTMDDDPDHTPDRSMFQTASVAIRVVMPMTWGMTRHSVAYLSGVAW